MTAVFAAGTSPALLAHQGGWDEFLLIGGPIVIICGLLWLAKRRVDAAHIAPGAGATDAGTTTGAGDDDGPS